MNTNETISTSSDFIAKMEHEARLLSALAEAFDHAVQQFGAKNLARELAQNLFHKTTEPA